MTRQTDNKLLSGIRVLDFTTFLSGPFATQTLGDLGAEVIKIETLEGDGTRHIPPHFVGSDSMYYMSTNRNKKSIAVDLKSEDGKKIVHEWVKRCDIVIENFRPGVTNRLEVDYPRLRELKPDIIYCSITGFGQDGPYHKRPAYDMIVQALSGSMSLTGEKDGDPVRLGVPLGDLAAGLYAVIGVLAALQHRQRTGQGTYLDISMLDCQLPLLSYLGVYYLHSGIVPGPQGREHESIPTYRAFKSREGDYVLITANTQKMFEGVCRAVEREDLIGDERFLTGELRHRHKDELVCILNEAFSRFDSKVLLERLEANEVPCAPLQNLRQAFEDPQVQHRKMILKLDHPASDNLRLIGNPIKYEGENEYSHVRPPLLGEHTESLLKEIGLSKEEIRRLAESGVVKLHQAAAGRA